MKEPSCSFSRRSANDSGRCQEERLSETNRLSVLLKREIREETGLSVAAVRYRQIFDRPKRGAITVLFAVSVKRNLSRTYFPTREIADLGFFDRLPTNATDLPADLNQTFRVQSLCNIFGFCLIPQSFVEKLVGRACPPSQVSASACSPRLMWEPEP
jgi:hypothetical protein